MEEEPNNLKESLQNLNNVQSKENLSSQGVSSGSNNATNLSDATTNKVGADNVVNSNSEVKTVNNSSITNQEGLVNNSSITNLSNNQNEQEVENEQERLNENNERFASENANKVNKKKTAKKRRLALLLSIAITLTVFVGTFVALLILNNKVFKVNFDIGPFAYAENLYDEDGNIYSLPRDFSDVSVKNGEVFNAPDNLKDIYNSKGELLVTFEGWFYSDGTEYTSSKISEDINLVAKYSTSYVKTNFVSLNYENESENKANSWLKVSITEGKNREVKNIMAELGLKVTRLIRTSFGPFHLGNLETGMLKEVPTKVLKEAIGNNVNLD